MKGVLRSAVALLLLTSCTATPAPAAKRQEAVVPHTPTATAAAAPRPEVTLAEAGRALSYYLATEDAVRASGDERMVLKLARDAQLPLTVAHYADTDGTLPRYTWGPRTLLVPRLKGDVNPWFAALVRRETADGPARTALLVFVRQKGVPTWQKSFEALLDPKAAPPKVELDANGYATALEPRDQTVLVSPNLFPPLHATVAEEGDGIAAARLIAPGKRTTGYYPGIVKDKRTAMVDGGLDYNSIFAAGTFPLFTLRTEDGGALVLYTVIRTTTWTTPADDDHQGLDFAVGRPWPIPKDARWALKNAFIGEERRIIATLQFAGVIPPKNSAGKAQVIGYDGFVTAATTRPADASSG